MNTAIDLALKAQEPGSQQADGPLGVIWGPLDCLTLLFLDAEFSLICPVNCVIFGSQWLFCWVGELGGSTPTQRGDGSLGLPLFSKLLRRLLIWAENDCTGKANAAQTLAPATLQLEREGTWQV